MGKAKAFWITLLYTVPMFLPALLYMGRAATNALWVVGALAATVIIYCGLREHGLDW